MTPAVVQRAVGMRGAADILGISTDTFALLLAVGPEHRLFKAATFLLERAYAPNPSDVRRHRRWDPADVQRAKDLMRGASA